MAKKFDKKFITIGLILGGMAAVAAGILGGVNLLTKDTIAANDLKSQEKALAKVFTDAASYSEAKVVDSDAHEYVLKEWEAFKEDKTSIGKIYYTSGKNAYGSVSLMVGIKTDRIANFAVVSNTESYASTLEENYIGKFLADPENTNLDDIDVSCGATYGAKLVKTMCDDALAYHLEGGK